jgi:hypothetical protein
MEGSGLNPGRIGFRYDMVGGLGRERGAVGAKIEVVLGRGDAEPIQRMTSESTLDGNTAGHG